LFNDALAVGDANYRIKPMARIVSNISEWGTGVYS